MRHVKIWKKWVKEVFSNFETVVGQQLCPTHLLAAEHESGCYGILSIERLVYSVEFTLFVSIDRWTPGWFISTAFMEKCHHVTLIPLTSSLPVLSPSHGLAINIYSKFAWRLTFPHKLNISNEMDHVLFSLCFSHFRYISQGACLTQRHSITSNSLTHYLLLRWALQPCMHKCRFCSVRILSSWKGHGKIYKG